MKRLDSGPLTRDAIVLLIHDDCKVARKQINLVLKSVMGLRERYLKPKSKE